MTLAILMNLGFGGSGKAAESVVVGPRNLGIGHAHPLSWIGHAHPLSSRRERRFAQQARIGTDTFGTGLEISGDGLLVISAATTTTLGGVLEAAARTDSSESAITLTAVTMPADTPVDADALRDDLVANALPNLETRTDELETSVETLAGEFNDLLAKLRTSGTLDS
jgi:hypothetical protein